MYGLLAAAALDTLRTNLAIGGCSFEALESSGNRRIYIYLFFSIDKCLDSKQDAHKLKLKPTKKPTQAHGFRN